MSSSSTSVEHTVRKVADESLAEMKVDLAGSKTTAADAINQRLNETLAEVQRISEQQERQADALRRQIIGTAEMSARNRSLEIVEEALNSAFDQAMVRLEASANSPSYSQILKTMILEAIDQIGGDEFVVLANARDRSKVLSALEEVARSRKAKLTLDGQTLDNSIGGVVVKSSDGFVTFDNTYEARLERLKPNLRKQIAQMFNESK